MSMNVWRALPLRVAIVELLQKKGALTEVELLELLKDNSGDVGIGCLNRTLMKMEIEGIIRVSMLTRGKRRVELAKVKGKENSATN